MPPSYPRDLLGVSKKLKLGIEASSGLGDSSVGGATLSSGPPCNSRRSTKGTSTNMSNEFQPPTPNEQQQPQQPGAGGGSTSAPYNQHPGNVHEPQNSSSVANSVVRDLMRVYESLTQSSTPQVSTGEAGKSLSPSAAFQPPAPAPHPYIPHPQQLQPNLPPSFSIPPPPGYHIPPGQNEFALQPPNAAGQQQQYYTDSPYNQNPYIMPQTEHQPQHGYSVTSQEAEQSQQRQDEDDETEPEETSSSGRSKRKRRATDSYGSSGGRAQKGRKKSKATDGRWSKRFTWPEDLHRDFVSAIFDVGLKHSSPATILEHMPKHEQITTERIKSHLQKYRMHRVKSKKEFVSSYEASLRNFQNRRVNGLPTASDGAVAAHLTYTTMNEVNNGVTTPPAPTTSGDKSGDDVQNEAVPSNAKAQQQGTGALILPQLTEAEKASPIGAAMGYLMGLFFSLKQQLMIQRAVEAAEARNKANAPVQDVFNSFVTGNAPSGNDMDPSMQQPGDGAGLKAGPQAVRTNIEENSIMKREMQNQMALQNKMRALKQQELNKYKNAAAASQSSQDKMEDRATSPPQEDEEKADEGAASRIQGAGESGGHDGDADRQPLQRGLSIGTAEEFWHSDVVDEQLFEFLMNN